MIWYVKWEKHYTKADFSVFFSGVFEKDAEFVWKTFNTKKKSKQIFKPKFQKILFSKIKTLNLFHKGEKKFFKAKPFQSQRNFTYKLYLTL